MVRWCGGAVKGGTRRVLASFATLALAACGPRSYGPRVVVPPAPPPPPVVDVRPVAVTPVLVVPVEPEPSPAPFTGYDADDILALDPDECRAVLADWGVTWETADDAPETIEDPIRLTGPAGGVRFRVPGEDVAPHDVIDCRFAVALAEWGAQLHERGVVEVDAFGFWRGGHRVGSHVRDEPTQHNYGLAIDAAYFVLEDDSKLVVLSDWEISGGEDWTCDATPEGDAAALLLDFFCAPAEASIFHVYIGPAHDAEHHNHFHFDLGGGGEGGWFLN
ncbi:MAG: extensin family protein [Deltaproteobacteria bacterium]|nr:extensin family protein [Deltaproteobacteria bacterium]